MTKLGLFAVVATLLLSVPSLQAESAKSGGIGGLIVGCCFGVRAAAAFNDGKDLHYRDWGRVIPVAGVVFAVWDGFDGLQGKTTAQLRETYGTLYY